MTIYPNQSKHCNKCNISKPITEFYKNTQGQFGVRSTCKQCVAEERIHNKDKKSEYNKQYYENNKDRILCNVKTYYSNNKNNILGYKKEYYKTNRDKIFEYTNKNSNKIKIIKKLWYAENKQVLKQKSLEYYHKNKERIKLRKQSYVKNNRQSINLYQRNRLRNNSLLKFSMNLRNSIRRAFKVLSIPKSHTSFMILGCSIEFFREYIENQFTEGMSFENYGKWHLDHIIPLASAKTEEDIIKLNHYTNFQPLWAIDNIKKGAKY